MSEISTNSNLVVQSSNSHERQRHDQVVFENVADHYVEGEDITAYFTILHEIKVNTNDDQIGLLRVGSTNIEECLAYASVQFNSSTTSGAAHQGTATFAASSLPVTDDGFYQFCYIVNKQKCLGSSIPFQLNCSIDDIDLLSSALSENSVAISSKKHNNNGLIALDDDDNEDLIVIHTKRMLIEEKLRQENRQLLEINKHLEQQKDECKAKLDLLEIKSNEYINKVKNDIQGLTVTHKATIEELSARQRLEAKLRKEYEACQDLCNQYQAESLQFAERCRALEDLNAQLSNQINKLGSELSMTKEFSEEQTRQISDYEKRLIESNELLKSAKLYQNQLDQQLRDLRLTTEKYQMSMQGQLDAYTKQASQQENQIHALESANSLLKEELIAVKNQNILLKATEQDKKVTKELQQQIRDLIEKHRLEDEQKQCEIERLRKELEQSNNGQNDYMKLKNSFSEIEKRCVKHQKSEIEVRKQFAAYKEFVSDLERKVQDLTERLSAGADEYKSLYRKYVTLECMTTKTNTQSSSAEKSSTTILTNETSLNGEILDCLLPNSNELQQQQQIQDNNNHGEEHRLSITSRNSIVPEEIRECPMCYWEFPKKFTLEKKKEHIDNHFT